jgi:hypothetical protein
MLTEETKVANCGSTPMEVGTMVARGRVWPRVRGYDSQWFQPATHDAQEILVWLNHVLEGDMEILESKHKQPPASVLLPWNKGKSNDCFRVDDLRVSDLQREKGIRDNMVVVDLPEWQETIERLKERKAIQVKKKEVCEEVKAGKRLIGLLNRVVDNRPVENFWF